MSVAPRVVLVTGGGKGIGKAVVARFAAAGDRVIAVGPEEGAAALESLCHVAQAPA